MADTYFGVGLKKGNFYDILASYCIFTPRIHPVMQIAIKTTDRLFDEYTTIDSLASHTAESVWMATPVGTRIFYNDLYQNGSAAKKIGYAQTHLAYLDAAKNKKIPEDQLRYETAEAYFQTASLCEKGDQFYCGAATALRIIADGDTYAEGTLGQTFAGYFGEALWHEFPREWPNHCDEITKREQEFAIAKNTQYCPAL